MIFKEIFSIFKVAWKKTIQTYKAKNHLNKEEAMEILNLNQGYTTGDLECKYKEIYNRNSLENKGSKYLQNLVKRAYKKLKDFN